MLNKTQTNKMEAPDDFTLVLSATKDKLVNTPFQLSQFSINLGSTIKLLGHYKCALTYLHYPKTYYNIAKSQLNLIAFFKLDNSVKTMSSGDWRRFEAAHKQKVILELQQVYHILQPEVKEEYRQSEAMAFYRFPAKQLSGRSTSNIFISDAMYRDESELINEINNAMDKLTYTDRSGQIKYVSQIPHVYLVKTRGSLGLRSGVIKEDGLVFPDLSEEIQNYLGFRKHFEFLDGQNVKIPDELVDKSKIYAMPAFKSNFHYIRVYSNFVKPSFVNNRLEPLLQIATIPTEAPFGEQIGVSYTPAHYLDVSVSEFNSIDVFLSFDGDSPIPLQNGEVILMLHVKKNYKN